MPAPTGVTWSADKIRRVADLQALYASWPGPGDPEDSPTFVRRAREIMGEPPLPSNRGRPSPVR